MPAPQKIIECPGCGHKMTIPRGYEDKPGKCRICGTPVNLDGGPPAPPDPAELLREASKKRTRRGGAREPLKRVLLKSLGAGVGVAFLGGAIMIAVMMLRKQAGTTPTILSIIASGDTGMVGGFVLGFCYMLIKKLSIGPLLGAVIGCSISTTIGVLCYLLEWAVVAPPDQRLAEAAIVMLFGGGIAGLVLGAKVGSAD